MRQAADEVRAAYGRCDILVNSAGFTKPVPHADLDALDDALIDSVLIANLRGPFAMIRAFAPLLRDSGEAVIVNVSSISGFTGSGSSIAYTAAKAALDNMTMALGRVLGPDIRIMCVSPGAVTRIFDPPAGPMRRSRKHPRKPRSGKSWSRQTSTYHHGLCAVPQEYDRREDRL